MTARWCTDGLSDAGGSDAPSGPWGVAVDKPPEQTKADGPSYFTIPKALVKGGHLSRISDQAATVLLVLYEHANWKHLEEKGEYLAWPSLRTIGELVGRRKLSVMRSIQELVAAGLLVVHSRAGSHNVYVLRIPTVAAEQPMIRPGSEPRKQKQSKAEGEPNQRAKPEPVSELKLVSELKPVSDSDAERYQNRSATGIGSDSRPVSKPEPDLKEPNKKKDKEDSDLGNFLDEDASDSIRGGHWATMQTVELKLVQLFGVRVFDLSDQSHPALQARGDRTTLQRIIGLVVTAPDKAQAEAQGRTLYNLAKKTKLEIACSKPIARFIVACKSAYPEVGAAFAQARMEKAGVA
ncbi:MAG: hypothetical protein AMXMBFR13_30640 [Phycisphaerae bacterium]